ncbi:hypothetical protein ACFYOI_14855 [Streptomyces microflavus]|uniref:hypothetical protein n=1 Tax=Streptomyces microflavus TaxID=1919 RepID=UPI0033AE3C73
MRTRTMGTAIAGAILAATAVVTGAGCAQAAAAEPVFSCPALLVDDINRVAGDNCFGGPAGYEGAGSITSPGSGVVWHCELLGTSADPAHPGKLTVAGVFGCEQQSGGDLS